MITILSPSKTQDFEDELSFSTHTQPVFLKETRKLAKSLCKLSEKKLSSLMSISPKLAHLNAERYKAFKTPFTPKNARQALIAFRGDVYQGFDLENYKKGDFLAAQKCIRILSGFYGLLAPLDLIQPYRLEMKTKLKTEKAKDLYTFWGTKLTQQLNKDLHETKSKYLINLASQEYSKALQTKDIEAEIITPVFKEKKGKTTKVVALFAKRARGMMANYIVKERVKRPEQLENFNQGGYRYMPSLSSESEYIFIR